MEKLQKEVKNLFDEVNKKKGLKPDPCYSFVRIVEEVGEIARQIFNKKVRPEKYSEDNFKEEIVDLIIELLYFSAFYDISVKEKISEKLAEIRKKDLTSGSKNNMPR